MVFDSVTTVLMFTPVVIRICEVTNINPVPVLMIIIVFCNIGGIGTPVGAPSNVVVLSNNYIRNHVSYFLIILSFSKRNEIFKKKAIP